MGESPILDKNGANFRSFTSKVSRNDAESYIQDIASIAIKFFPNRIFLWNDHDEVVNRMYDWEEIQHPTTKYINNDNFDFNKFCDANNNDDQVMELKLKYFMHLLANK